MSGPISTRTAMGRFFGALGLLLLLGGCASVNFDYPKEESTFIADTDETYLGRRVAAGVARNPGKSAFLMQNDGVDALAARVLGAFHAEKTIDVQYYLIKADPFGFVFIEALLAAADRGVRVRVLLDDVFTEGYDEGMAALDEHPNIEIRIWNPVARGGSRVLNALTDFRRVNRRMHNKTFIVDNQVAIIGGRNIAAEYFAGRRDVNFGDLDAVCFGPIVSQLSTMYDMYWNDRLAVPIDALVKLPENLDEIEARLRQKIAESRAELNETHYGEVLLGRVWQLEMDKAGDFQWAPWQLVYDLPEKASNPDIDEADSILPSLREALLNAEESVLILSPYFVPREQGTELLTGLAKRGVDVRVVTNSYASNNQKLVHSGYAPTRKKLLEAGVKLYEIRPDAKPIGVARLDEEENDDSIGTMHIKAFVVDDRIFFLGSFNFDPRSAYINTESGVIVDSPELGGWGVARVEERLPTVAYALELTDNYRLRWSTIVDGEEVVYTKEPETTAWQRFKVRFFSILPIKGQL
jgi:putative cardiolipin synthase